MKNIARIAFAVSFFMVLGGNTIVNAFPPPTPLARFVLPTNTTAAAVQPTFKIITKYKIDTSSVHWKWALVDDSTKVQVPTICVLPYPSYSSFDTLSFADTIWALIADTGTGTIINDTTIEFEASTLPNSQLFEAVLMGLRVIDTSGDTITIPDTVARLSFTTIALPPRLGALSIFGSNSIVRSADTLTASFSSKLDSTNSALGPLVSIVIQRPSHTDSIVSASAWLDASDSSEIHILPNSHLSPGQNYAMKIALNGLTGDSIDDRAWPFLCQKSFRLNITAVPTGGLTCLDTVHFNPPINENYKMQYDSSFDSLTMTEIHDTSVKQDTNFIGTIINAGDTVTYLAPIQVGGAVFKQWTGTGIVAIDTSTNPMLTISETAATLHDVTAIPLYQQIHADTVCTSTAGTNTAFFNSNFIGVRSDSEDCPFTTLNDTCASTSSVSYLLEQDKMVTLNAFSTSDSIQFDHWSSSDGTINGQTNPTIAVQPTGNVCATATFSTLPPSLPPGTQYHIYVQIWDITSQSFINPTDSTVSYIMANDINILNSTTWWYQAGSNVNENVRLKEEDPSYMVEGFSISYGTPPSTGVDSTVNANFCVGCTFEPNTHYHDYTTLKATYVTFYIQKVAQLLTIEVALNDNYFPTGTLFITPSTSSTTHPTGAYISVNEEPMSWSSHAYAGDANHPNCYRWFLLYPFSTTSVNVTAGVKSGSNYSFLHWDNHNPPNTNYPASPYTNPTTYSVSLTQNPLPYVTAVFSEPFILESISFQQDVGTGLSRSASNYTMPVAQWGTENNLCDGVPWAIGPLSVTLHFNKPISGIGSISIAGITYSASPNYTGSNATSYVHWQPEQSTTNGEDIILTLTDGIDNFFDVWKGQTGSLYVGVDNAVTDEDGDPLSNPGTFSFSTVGPDVNWTIQWFWPMGVCDETLLESLFPSLFSPELDNFYTHGLGYYQASGTSGESIMSTFDWPNIGGNEEAVCNDSTISDPPTSPAGYYGFDVNKVLLSGVIGMRTDGFTSEGGCEGANWNSIEDFVGYVLEVSGIGDAILLPAALFDIGAIDIAAKDDIIAGTAILAYEAFTGPHGCGRYIGYCNWPQQDVTSFWGYWLNDDGIYGHIQDPDWATPYGSGDYGALKSHVNVTVQ
jgi:hypothetical protein